MNCGNCEVPRCVLLFSVLSEIIIVKCKVNLEFFFCSSLCMREECSFGTLVSSCEAAQNHNRRLNLNVMFIFLLFIITH